MHLQNLECESVSRLVGKTVKGSSRIQKAALWTHSLPIGYVCTVSFCVSCSGDAFVSGWSMLNSSYQLHGCFELFEVFYCARVPKSLSPKEIT